MTIMDLRKKKGTVHYIGFDEMKKMWVYTLQDMFDRKRTFAVIAGQMDVIELLSLKGLNLCKH
ncbi:hypothetical protein [Paenibacillus methanolicus]|uniref:Uncharacterized protein n=1 Tax=Paenibacillus methanolicus TaxID=582686 RepID=A0A5S5CJD5_9BACL|nr:hypothetical protein [Paenibacillus methanolicus]TYP79850.1 hypothetical protein BCM02_101971 [Paenibacillus methanolicus]